MSQTLSLAEIKERWNEVLDALEQLDRVAWLAFFDGRLVSVEGNVLTLDFSDANKFSGAHDFTRVRLERFRPSLEKVLTELFGQNVAVREIS